ncbi:hypothetical protein Sjap_000236 [Stephania japonica]|uniref:RING-type E3 ubiquitin transferase n=1 Tax=Stephania japonica TaxID=461633 RepID=A0AAP0PTU2_9MAGN
MEAQAEQSIKPSRVRVRAPNPILLSLLLSIILHTRPISSTPTTSIPYRDHCNSVVPEPNLSSEEIFSYDFLALYNSYYLGGDPILSQPSQNPQLPNSFFPKSPRFRTNRLTKTAQNGVLQVEGTLIFRGIGLYYSGEIGNYTVREVKRSRFRTRKPRFGRRRERVSFELKGFWSGLDGRLCMVGSGIGYSKGGDLIDLSCVFKAKYVNSSNLLNSLVTGSLESLDSADKESYFSPVSMLAYSPRNYNYSLIKSERESGGFDRVNVVDDDGDDGEASLSIGSNGGWSICSAFQELSYGGFELEHGNGSQCDSASKNCVSPLGEKFFGGKPGFMSFGEVQCSETDNQTMRLLLEFSNSSWSGMRGYYNGMDPKTSMVGEGVWDGEKNRVCIVACHVLNYEKSLLDATVGDCSVRMRVKFPAVMTIKSRSSVVGQIWSNKTVKESDRFDGIKFRSSRERNAGAPGLKYQYTELERVKKLCPKKAVVGIKRKVYPDVYSYDMRFDMNVKNSKGESTWGYFTPLSIGDVFFEQSVGVAVVAMAPQSSVVYRRQNYSSVMNVSYAISISNPVLEFDGRYSSANSTSWFQIRAEGVYDSGSGSLCMIGCRDLASNLQGSKQNETLDCEILINAQFPPRHAKKKANVEGTIESTRKKSDLLHFERLEFSAIAMSTTDAVESIWRMDLEITMVLISNTLLCIFVCLQLFYVKKHPDVLPSISLLMLVILTLGSMIPLVLNFEALFLYNRTRQNVLSGGGGWLEVNEVIVRVVTMVAFLLQVRLVQLTWSSRRTGDGNQKGVWTAEKKALYVLLPLYLLGGLIAWFVLRWDNYSEVTNFSDGSVALLDKNHSLLGDLRSYAGLLLDGFLLPQILLNIFLNSKDKILSHAFYLGVTAVRLLPHAYDLYRVNSYSAYNYTSYFYANPHGDYFSTAWDVIILCGGSILGVLVYVQQRVGGRCILPRSFRGFDLYEKVPVSTGE